MDSALVPQRQSLLADTTQILRQAILSGRWENRLPGERKLSRQMQIGRDTLRLAIKQLQRERLIGHGEPGKPRRILVKANQDRSRTTKTSGVIGFLTPHPLERLTVTALLEIDKLRHYLHSAGFQLEVTNSAKASILSRPGHALERISEEVDADAWILHQSTEPIQRWFVDRHLPCLLHGQPHENIDLPYVDVDYLAVGRHAGGHLINRGHRQVVFLRPRARLRGLEMAEAGLYEAFAQHAPESLPKPLTVTESGSSAETGSLTEPLSQLLLAGNRPTALVATRTRQVLTILSWLAQNRLTIPSGISVIALDHAPFFDHLIPQITCYRIDVEHTAKSLYRKALELAKSQASECTPEALMPDFVTGASVARVSANSTGPPANSLVT
jgi:DNA-binding LacI/PurR family transcriptional regulator